MQYLQLQSLLPDWQQQLQQARLQKVVSHGNQVLRLQWYAQGSQQTWFSVLDFSQGRSLFFVTDALPSVLPRVPAQGFVMALRKYLVGLRLLTIEQRPGDRWLDLVLETAEGTHFHVILELSGRHGNVFLLNPQYQVIVSLRPDRSWRRLRAGQPYVPPALPETGLRHRDDPLRLAALPLGQRAPHFAQFQRQRYLGAHQQQLLTRLKNKLFQRLAQNQKQQVRWEQALDLQAREQWELWAMQLQGAFAHPPPAGATAVEVPDYTRPDQARVSIPLQPHLRLAENISRYYQLAKKASRRAAYAEAHLPALWEQIAQDQKYMAQLHDWQAVLTAHGELPESVWTELSVWDTPVQKKIPVAKASPLRHHARGFVLGEVLFWVGKSDKDNHQLTFRDGKGQDGWCHVQDTAGSHVLCKAPWRADTLKAAAHLAAYYSPQRQAFLRGQGVAVSYTQVKYVQSLKGAKPGQVQLKQFKTYQVRYDANFWETLHA